MFYHIGRLLRVYLLSVYLAFIILLKFSNLLLAANQVDQSYGLKEDVSYSAILGLFFQDNFFLKISQDTYLTIYESLLVFAGSFLLVFQLMGFFNAKDHHHEPTNNLQENNHHKHNH